MSFTGEIRRAEPHDLMALAQISSLCFEYPFEGETDPQKYYESATADIEHAKNKAAAHLLDKYVAQFDGQVIAGLCALPYNVEFDGSQASMCGIGGVCTLPPYRRHGAIREIMTQTLHDEYDKGTEFSYLYPFSQGFYEKFGYTQSEPCVQVTLSLDHAVQYDHQGSFSLYRNDADLQEFSEAYERMTGYNMMIRRERCDYDKVIQAEPFTNNTYAYLYRDNGVPRGYFVFRKAIEGERHVMDVSEIVYDCFDTLSAIISFATSFRGSYDTIRFFAPAGQHLEKLCKDQAVGRFSRVLLANGMVRVVHVENALRKARFLGSGEAYLRIFDSVLSDHTIGFRYTDGMLADLGRTSHEPDAEMSIHSFSALLTGRHNIQDLAFIPDVHCANAEALKQVFYKKSIYINNYF